jgi:hypothetical protein
MPQIDAEKTAVTLVRRGGSDSPSLPKALYFFNRNDRQGFARITMVQVYSIFSLCSL